MIAWTCVILFWCAVIYVVGRLVDSEWLEIGAIMVSLIAVLTLLVLLSIAFLRFYEAWPFVAQ